MSKEVTRLSHQRTKPIALTNQRLDHGPKEAGPDYFSRQPMIDRAASRRPQETMVNRYKGAYKIDIPVKVGTPGSFSVRDQKVDVSVISKTPFIDTAVKAAIQKIAPSVVMVKAVGTARDARWSGSGVIIDLSTYFPGQTFPPGTYAVLTNNHVTPLGETRFLSVTLADGREVPAQVLKSYNGKTTVQDGEVDASIMIIHSDVPLPTAKVATTAPEVGDTILTAGHPIGLPNMSFTKGIVSQESQETGSSIYTIQHDAEINPGNSGGPLFNLQGEVLGLNTFSFRDTVGLSFAMPVHTQLKVLSTIYKTGKFVRGDFGFDVKAFSYLDRKLSGFPLHIPGVKVGWVNYGSEASTAGLKKGDIITDMICNDGTRLDVNIHNSFQTTRFSQWMHSKKPGAKVAMVVYRPVKNGDKVTYERKEITLNVGMKKRSKTTLKSQAWGFILKKDSRGRGILTDIAPDSPASKAGLQSGKWALIGIKAPQISDKPVLVDNLEKFKQMLIMLGDSEAPELTLYVVDKDNPSVRKKIKLTREIMEEYLASRIAAEGISEYLSA